MRRGRTPRRFTIHVTLEVGAEIATVLDRVRRELTTVEWGAPRRLVADEAAARLGRALPADRQDRAPPLDRHWSLVTEERLSRGDAARAMRAIRDTDGVAWAGAVARAEDPCPAMRSVHPNDDPEFDENGHLMGDGAIGHGVDAWYAWRFAAGDGERACVVDVERGWHLDHEDIEAYDIGLPGDSVNHADHRDHGLAVLAVVGARDNSVGMLGVAPGLGDLFVASTVRDGDPLEEDDHVEALCEAWDLVRADRGVILIESQVFALNSDGTENDDIQLPAEYLPAVREVVWHIIASGTTVVAVAGNAPEGSSGIGEDLAAWLEGRGQSGADAAAGIARPNADGITDSGSILVGAVDSASPHAWDTRTNHGLPVDCWAWSDNVRTATRSGLSGLDWYGYFGSFNGGTSAAAAIVAGVAAVYRSLFEEYQGRAPEPEEVRAALHSRADPPDPALASTTSAPDSAQLMPNLRRLIDEDLQIPYVWVRSAVGDRGEPSRRNTSQSPDIIPWPVALSTADAQAAFGPGSGTELTPFLGDVPSSGTRGHTIVRVQNRTLGARRRRVRVNLFEGPLSTSPCPWLWGGPRRISIDGVPADSWALGRARLVSADAPRSFATVMGIAGRRPDRRSDLLEPGRMRWLQRQMRAIATRSVARLEDAIAATTHDGTSILALPFLIAGEPDRDSEVRLRVRYTASPSIRACVLVEPGPSILGAAAPPTDAVVHPLLPPGVVWFALPFGSSFDIGPLSIPAATTIPVALGFEAGPRPRRVFQSAEIIQTDARNREMGRINWLAQGP